MKKADSIEHLFVGYTVYHITILEFRIYPTRFIANSLMLYLYDKSQRGRTVNTKEAVACRIIELCRARNLAVNALANISGVSPSTIYSMLNQKSKNPGVVSIKKHCDGLQITVREFFDSALFDETEQEIK